MKKASAVLFFIVCTFSIHSMAAGPSCMELFVKDTVLPNSSIQNTPPYKAIQKIFKEAGVIVGKDVIIHDNRFYSEVLRDFELKMGETYMDGMWSSPHIDVFLSKLIAFKRTHPDQLKSILIKEAPLAGISNKLRGFMRELEGRFFNMQSRRRAKIVAEEHYDAGNILYNLMLDPTMTYTSGYWPKNSKKNVRDRKFTLEDSQNAKYNLLAQKMDLKPGQRVLDIGCGFGGFARFAAKNYGAKVIGITISGEQLKAARAMSKGIENVEFLFMDYRDIPHYFERDFFDHIVSIEMIEAVGPKNLKEYFDAAGSRLKAGGRFVIQSINGQRDRQGPNNAWFHKYIFPNGVAPSKNQMDQAAQESFGPAKIWHDMKGDYDRTLLAWHKNFVDNWSQIEGSYSPRFKRMWEFYLLSVAASFRNQEINVHQSVYVKGQHLDASALRLSDWTKEPSIDDLMRLRQSSQEIRDTKETLENLELTATETKKPTTGKTTPVLARDAKIAIIGGGVSGLGAAYELMKSGYSNVTVIEKAPELGGKSHTVMIDGKPHDLGATMGVQGLYKDIIKMGELSNQKTVDFPEQIHFSTQKNGAIPKGTITDQALLIYESIQFVLHHYFKSGWNGNRLETPDPKLAEPWNVTLKRMGLHRFAKFMQTYMTGYGYGYGDSPLVYALRMLTPQALFGAAKNKPIMWENGTQEIWKGLGQHLSQTGNVRIQMSTTVTKIVRSNGKVYVYTDKQTEPQVFDKLVMATDPNTALKLLDVSKEEHALMSMVEYMPYATFAMRVEGFSDKAHVGYLKENMSLERVGHPMAWIQRYDNQPLLIFHLFAPASVSDQQIVQNIRDAMTQLGARSVELMDSRRWPFFPHVKTDRIVADHFFDRFNVLQGENNTVYANEAIGMSTMPNSFEVGRKSAQKLIGESSF